MHHDDDWVTNASPPPDWMWQDTSARFEHLLMLDASPRFLLDFLPGRDWVFMLKGRFIYNASYENQMSLMARPELTWFWVQDRVPILNVSLSYELYFPLNFGTTLLYQSYPYLTLLWHATPEVGIELGGAWKSTTWSPSQDVLNSGQPIAGSFPITFHTWVGITRGGLHPELLSQRFFSNELSRIPRPARITKSGQAHAHGMPNRKTALSATSSRPPISGPREAAVNLRSFFTYIWRRCHQRSDGGNEDEESPPVVQREPGTC